MRALFLVVITVLLPALCYSATVSLQWDYVQGTTSAVQFIVYRQVNNGAITKVGIVSVPVQTYTDSTVLPGTTYTWTVTAIAATGEESAPSNALSFRVPLPSPASPANLHGTIVP